MGPSTYTPGRFSSTPLQLPAPSSLPVGERPTAIVPRNPGALVPTTNVVEGQFTKLAPQASLGSKALPFVGDALVGTMYGMDPEKGSVGRGVAAGLGSFAGRTLGAAGGALTGPGAPVAVPVLSVGGSIAGAEGAAQLYDYLAGGETQPPTSLSPGVQQALSNRNPVPSAPTQSNRSDLDPQTANLLARAGVGFAEPAPRNAVPKLVDPTSAEQVEHRTALKAFSDPEVRQEMGRQNVFPGETSTPREESNPKAQVRKAEPVKKTEGKPAEFQGPSEAEMKRFRTLTGTNYDKNSVTDKLNLERMRAGEETMTSKQSRQWRNANPTYRPGMYSRMKK